MPLLKKIETDYRCKKRDSCLIYSKWNDQGVCLSSGFKTKDYFYVKCILETPSKSLIITESYLDDFINQRENIIEVSIPNDILESESIKRKSAILKRKYFIIFK